MKGWLTLEVVAKDEYERNDSSVASKVSNTSPREEMTRTNDGWMVSVRNVTNK